MLKDDIYSADEYITTEEGIVSEFTNRLIQNNLGIHFSSGEEEGEEEELPDVLDALDQTLKAQEATEKIKQSQAKGKAIGHSIVKAKGRKKEAANEFKTEKLIRETGAPLPVIVTKPKTFASLTKRSDKLDDNSNKLAFLKRRLTPEQFELLKKNPRLTADESINTTDNLVIVNAGNARRIGKREGSVGIPVPRTKTASIDLLNKQLDAKIVTQGSVYERLHQVKMNKKKKWTVPQKTPIQPQAENRLVAPFGYDRAKSLQRQFEERKQAEKDASEKDIDEVELNPLLYPDEEPLVHKSAFLEDHLMDDLVYPDIIESVEESESGGHLVDDDNGAQSKHVSFEGSMDAQGPVSPKVSPSHKKLASLFVDDEAESGDSDEEVGDKAGHQPAEYYDEDQYRKDVEDFVTDDESMEGGNMQDIHRKIAMEDDKRAINALVNKFGIVDNETAAWMQRMHDTNKEYNDTQESVPTGSKLMSAEHASKIRYLTKLGFTRTRVVQPATNEFLFPEETKGTTSSHLPTSEPNDSDLGSFNFEPSEESSAEEMDCQIPSDSEMLVDQQPSLMALEGAPEIQDLGVVELCDRKDAFGMLGRKHKPRPQSTQPSNLIVSSKKVIQ